MSDIDEIIENGMVFRGAPKAKADDGKIKTKAKKKKYIISINIILPSSLCHALNFGVILHLP
mgnify:CR=1 FL=1